jgi:hypothetical protein
MDSPLLLTVGYDRWNSTVGALYLHIGQFGPSTGRSSAPPPRCHSKLVVRPCSVLKVSPRRRLGVQAPGQNWPPCSPYPPRRRLGAKAVFWSTCSPRRLKNTEALFTGAPDSPPGGTGLFASGCSFLHVLDFARYFLIFTYGLHNVFFWGFAFQCLSLSHFCILWTTNTNTNKHISPQVMLIIKHQNHFVKWSGPIFLTVTNGTIGTSCIWHECWGRHLASGIWHQTTILEAVLSPTRVSTRLAEEHSLAWFECHTTMKNLNLLKVIFRGTYWIRSRSLLLKENDMGRMKMCWRLLESMVMELFTNLDWEGAYELPIWCSLEA